MRILLITLLTIVFVNAYSQEVSKSKVLDRANMDLTAKPGDNFEQYAGGVWLQKNPVPAKETNWGSFTILRDFNVKAVRVIVNDAQADKSAPEGSIKKRVGDFYAAGMDRSPSKLTWRGPAQWQTRKMSLKKSTSSESTDLAIHFTASLCSRTASIRR